MDDEGRAKATNGRQSDDGIGGVHMYVFYAKICRHWFAWAPHSLDVLSIAESGMLEKRVIRIDFTMAGCEGAGRAREVAEVASA